MSIAEFYGPKGVQETFQRVKTDWGGNVEYWTEFVICLNWKIWQWYNKNDELAKLYNTLWEQADEYARDTFTGDDLDYFYIETD